MCMKRLICCVIGSLISLTLLANTCVQDDIYYTLNAADNTAKVIANGRGDYAGAITIPPTLYYAGQTYQVTAIGQLAFDQCINLTSIELPETLTAIGAGAFQGCSSLTSIRMGDAITQIGENAFYGCSNLTTLHFPDSLKTIVDGVCYNCTHLSTIVLPTHLQSIGSLCFNQCFALTQVEIPTMVTTIGDGAFQNCTSLSEVSLGDNVQTIGKNAFYGCSHLDSITIPASVNSIKEAAFFRCERLRKVTILATDIILGSFSQTPVFQYCVINDMYCDESVNLQFAGGTIKQKHPLPEVKIEEEREEDTPQEDTFISFKEYAQKYVELHINQWQKKGEYEKTNDWRVRVNDSTRTSAIQQFLEEAKQTYIPEYAAQHQFHFTLGHYDADNEVYLFHEDRLGNLLVPVPIQEAPSIKRDWEKCVPVPTYTIVGTEILLASISFQFPLNKTYTYQADQNVTYSQAEITYNFDSVDLNLNSIPAPQPKGQQIIQYTQLTIGHVDVDVNIPTSKTIHNKTFAFLIGNEHYPQLASVPYAERDAQVMATYCEKTLGMPRENIRLYTDATFGKFLSCMRDIRAIADVYEGDVNILFYYAGHGLPDEVTKSAYLLPVDADGGQSESYYPLSRLYSELAQLPAHQVIVLMDACFSGAQRGEGMILSARGVALKTKEDTPKGNLVVFSAASGDQTALPYEEMQHGLFTYYLLKHLQQTKGKTTLTSLAEYVIKEVKQRSVVVNKKGQTPNLSASAEAKNWERWTLY